MILVLADRGKQSQVSKSTEKTQRNLLKTLVLVSAAYLVLWTPGTMIWTLEMYDVIGMSLVWGPVSVVLTMITVCVNPFIYIAKYKEFKDGMAKMLARGQRCMLQTGAPFTLKRVAALSKLPSK